MLKEVIKTLNGLKIVEEKPVFGKNYNIGYIGFSNNYSRIAKAIKWGTKYDKKEKIEATHALIVISETECIEALMGKGVVISPLSKYFEGNEFDLILRKPKDYNENFANQITQIAKEQLGAPYSKKAILGSLLRGLFLGHIVDMITKDKLFDILCQNHFGKQTFICSGLVAFCLQKISSWKYNSKGNLKRKFGGINPVELLYDDEIFEPFEEEKPNTEIFKENKTLKHTS